MSKMLTNNEFIEKLGVLNPNIYTNDIYSGYRNRMIFYCKKYNHSWNEFAGNALSGCDCPYCANKKVLRGFNDLWTTHPEIAKLLENPDDGYNYTFGSEKKLRFICPNCKNVIESTARNVYINGLGCKKCSDGISYPNKFMFNMLQQCNIDFVAEYTIDGINRRYDFYLNDYKLIIEMHGEQHYYGWNDKRSLCEIQQIDVEKEKYARQHGILNYIVIDSAESDMDYIRKNIISSDLSKFINLSKVDWLECALFATSSFVKIAADLYIEGYNRWEISNKLNVCDVTVWKWLKTADKLGLCHYKPKNLFVENKRFVICLTTNEIFDSVLQASKKYNVPTSRICKVCAHKLHYKSAGKHPVTGQKLEWAYYDEYLTQQNDFKDGCLNG